MRLSGLYLITDRRARAHRSILQVAREAIAGGLRLLQYREKDRAKKDLYEEAVVLRDMTRSSGAILIINDDVDLALAVGADGVHLGQEDLPIKVAREILGPDRIIGISARTPSAVRSAAGAGADYIAIGPIFPSKIKQVVPPLGCEIIREARRLTDRPLFGIGGIDRFNACEVICAGADGVAVISAIHDAHDVAAATREMIEALAARKKETSGS